MNTVLAGVLLQVLLTVIIPIVFLIVLLVKKMFTWKAFGAGILIFILFSQILEKLLHIAVLAPTGTALKWTGNPYMFAVYGALAAGVFEEVGRYFAFRVMLKNNRAYKDGLSYGLGHGGTESVLIGAFSAVNTLVIYFLIKSGSLEQTLGAAIPQEQLHLIKEQLANSHLWLIAAGGMERLFAIALHIALSILVLIAVREKQWKYLMYAILFHAAANFLPGLYQAGVITSLLFVEIILLIIAVISVVFTYRMNRRFQQ